MVGVAGREEEAVTYEEIAAKYEDLATIEEAKAKDVVDDPENKSRIKPGDYSYHMEKALQYRAEANRQRAMAEAKESDAHEQALRIRDIESAIAWRRNTTALHERNVLAWESIAATLAKAETEIAR